MASPPRLKTLRMEDFPDAPEWFEKAVSTLNPFLNDTTSAISKRLSVDENLAMEYRSVVATAPDWVAPELENGWENYAGGFEEAGLWFGDDGFVNLRGVVKDGSTTPDDEFLTLPTGYAPAADAIFHTGSDSGGTLTFSRFDVTADGTVIFKEGDSDYFNLGNVRWYVGTPPAFSGPGWPITLTHGLSSLPQGVLVVGARDMESDATLAFNSVPAWSLNADGTVQIRRVAGLTPGRKYQLTFLLVA